MKFCMSVFAAAIALVAIQPAWSQDADSSVTSDTPAVMETQTPLNKGFYVAPMASYVMPYNNRGLSDGVGGTLGLGYRYGALAIEALGEYAKLDAKGDAPSSKLTGVYAGLLWFPLESIKGLYAAAAIGRLETKRQPVGNLSFESDSLEAGAGYLFPISFGHYEFGVRAEARVRFSERGRVINLGDDNQPRRYQDVLLNLGFQLPLGMKKDPPPPTPVQVVAPPSACSDGVDNDSDGKIDYPNDPGCTTVDDNDETDPCKAPLPGERISLKGCGMGDVLVLRGVNFDFDKASLTPNAKTILDNVADELLVYTDIKVEIAGHTDAKGSDEYNQKLSEQRAASVVEYLTSKGVTSERLSSVGYGESQPVADNETDEGRELNRRVELKVTGGNAVAAPAPEASTAAPGTESTSIAAAPADAVPVAPEPALPAAAPAEVGPEAGAAAPVAP